MASSSENGDANAPAKRARTDSGSEQPANEFAARITDLGLHPASHYHDRCLVTGVLKARLQMLHLLFTTAADTSESMACAVPAKLIDDPYVRSALNVQNFDVVSVKLPPKCACGQTPCTKTKVACSDEHYTVSFKTQTK